MDFGSPVLVYSASAGTTIREPFSRKLVMSSAVQPPNGRRQVLLKSVSGAVERIVRVQDNSVAKDGSSWGNVVQVETTNTSYTTPCLLLDSNGYLHALYRKRVGSFYRARYAQSTDGGATWGSYSDVPFPYLASQHVEFMGGCIGPDNSVYCFGVQRDATVGLAVYCYKRNPSTGVWTAPAPGLSSIMPRTYPSTTMTCDRPSAHSFIKDGQQHLEVTFHDRNGSGVYKTTNVYTNYDPDTFTWSWIKYPGPSPATPYVDYESVTDSVCNCLAISVPKNHAYLVYMKKDGSGIYQIYFKKKTLLQNDWGAAVKVNLANASIGTFWPTISVGIDGRLYVAWTQKNNGLSKGSGQYVEV